MEEESLTDLVVKGSFWAGFSKFLERLGALFFTIILARFLFPQAFGIYTLTISLASIFMLFADVGIDSVLIRYSSLNFKNKEKMAAYFQYIFKLKFIVSFLASFALLAGAYPLSFWIYKKPELFLPLIMASVFILTSLFVNFFSSYFYVIKKFKYLGIKEIVFQAVRFLSVFLVFILVASTYYIIGVIFGLVLTNLIMILLLFLWLNKLTPHIFKKSKEKIDKRKILKFLGYITIAGISGVFHTNMDIVILGFFVSFAYIGYYKVAFSLVFGLAGIFSYLNSVLLPIFTNLRGRKLEIAFNKVLRFVLIFSIPATFGALALGRYFIKLLYGDNYMPSQYPFYALSFMLIAYIPIMIMATLFYSKEKPKYVAKTVLISLLLNFILNYILISSLVKVSELLAIFGAGFASIGSKYFAFFYLSGKMKKNLNIKLKKIYFLKPIMAGFIMLLSLSIMNFFIVKDMSLITGVGEIFLGIIIYFLIMYLIRGVGKEDIEILKRIPILRKK